MNPVSSDADVAASPRTTLGDNNDIFPPGSDKVDVLRHRECLAGDRQTYLCAALILFEQRYQLAEDARTPAFIDLDELKRYLLIEPRALPLRC